MPDLAEILPPHPDGDDLFCLDSLIEPARAPARPARADGWTAERQRKFLEMLAEGHTITNACLALGMSVTSAYTLRRSARGAAFALGWQAALLLAREHLADKLLERAVHGSVETITHADGSTVTRQRHDNRLAMHMLNRLDRMADEAQGPADHAAARLAAAEFDQYLDLVARDGGAARAAMFLARRLAGDAGDAAPDDLAPVRTLARADAWLRGRSDAAEAVAVADLDPAQRAGWSAEQWARAEAAGLLVLAPPAPAAADESAHGPKLPQLRGGDAANDEPVWWDGDLGEWRTRFPPPEGFTGEEWGDYGEPDYARELSPEELEVLEGPLRAARAARRAAAAQERDAFFAEGVDVIEVDANGVPLWGAVESEGEAEAMSPSRKREGGKKGASSHPGTPAAPPGLTPPADAPISPPARARGASKRQRIREGTMPSNDQSRPTAPVQAAALI